jgi:hypothetical protein
VLLNPDGFDRAKMLDSGARPAIVSDLGAVLGGQQFPHCQVQLRVESQQASRRC